MKELALTIEFWVAVFFAVAMKLRASPSITIAGAVTTTLTAVASALVFTEPVLAWMRADPETYRTAATALVALTGEHVARQIMNMKIGDFFKLGGGKK